MRAEFKIDGKLISLEYTEIFELVERVKSYTLKEKDLYRIDEILTQLKTKTTLDELIRCPQRPDWCINDVLVTRIRWTGTGEEYRRKEYSELITSNLEKIVIALEGILKLISDKNKKESVSRNRLV